MQAMPSDVVSQGPVPVPEPDPSSQNGMETADTEQQPSERAMEGEGEGGEDEQVISMHVESSESLQPSTSQELVKPVSEQVERETTEMTSSSAEVGEGGESGEGGREEGEVATIDDNSLNLPPKPVEQVKISLLDIQ